MTEANNTLIELKNSGVDWCLISNNEQDTYVLLVVHIPSNSKEPEKMSYLFLKILNYFRGKNYKYISSESTYDSDKKIVVLELILERINQQD